jgi:hypothetical protein
MFLPINIILTLIFTAINVVQMPLAYVIHTVALIKTLTDSDETMDDFNEKFKRFMTIVKFIVIGPFYLLTSIPIDAFVFFYNMYTQAYDADFEEDVSNVFTKESLEQFSLTCERTLVQAKKLGGDNRTSEVNFVELNKNLQEDLNIQEKIRELIYNNVSSDKFIHDPHTNTTRLNPQWLTSINEYNTFKKLVFSSADKKGSVNIDSIRSLIDQVNLRCKMLELEKRLGGLEMESEDVIYSYALYELAKCEPMGVESQLSDEGQMIENVDQKITGLTDNLLTFQTQVMQRLELMQSQINTGFKPKRVDIGRK